MTYGVPERGSHPWTLDEEQSRPFIREALELGINFFDTANSYSDGTSEQIVGRALRDFARRDEVVIATGDFAPWNLRFEHRRLFGILDFELAHCVTASATLRWLGAASTMM